MSQFKKRKRKPITHPITNQYNIATAPQEKCKTKSNTFYRGILYVVVVKT